MNLTHVAPPSPPHHARLLPSLFCRSLFTGWLLATAAALAAQTVSPSSTRTPAPESTITLSPFEVREDSENGYTATSALSGGRTDTPLKLTAAAISVMTSQFLQDVAATDFQTSLQWAT